MGKKEGAVPKDKVITDNFNAKKIQTPAEIKVLQQASVAHARSLRWVKKQKDDSVDDEAAANQMLQDMRHGYLKCGGRKKLVELMKDDKEFKFVVKELMKVETTLLSAKIRKEGDGAAPGQMVFVVLKGLEDEINIKTAMEDKTVDMKQIAHALNPDGSEYQKGGE
jgi:hypothetical protein